MTTHIHLNLNIRVLGFHRAGWRHASSAPKRVEDVSFYIELAQLAEKGKLDAIFLADTPVLNPLANSRQPLDHALEPFSILAAIASSTKNIGLIATTSTTYSDLPVAAARAATVDYLSGGRAGVNFVTNAGTNVARNFGYDEHPEYADRYARAEEFVGAMLELWGSTVKPGNGSSKSQAERQVRHEGRYFNFDHRLDIPRSPQDRPLIVQAGASESGRNFAAKFAEVIYSASSTVENGRAFYNDIKSRARGFGRNPASVRILPGIVPFIGATEKEARDLEAELESLSFEVADPIRTLSEKLQFDLSAYDPDGPLPFDDLPNESEFTQGVTGQIRLVNWAREENLSIAQLAKVSLTRLSGVQWKVTGTGEQIADKLEEWFRAGAADGFNVLTSINPKGVNDLVEQVVPVLQKRGLFRSDYEGSTLRDNYSVEPALA